MKILLSAYACEPDKGSEPGVGWNWALALARRGHDVWVITRKNNQTSIEQAMLNLGGFYNSKLHFIYHDAPNWILRWKKNGLGVHLYYALWQKGILKLALAAHQQHQFDVVQHLTFGVWRQPTQLFKLNIPCIFGPVGGGESAPWPMANGIPNFKSNITEYIRFAVNGISLINPWLRICLRQSALIVAKTHETANWIKKVGLNSLVSLEIGINADRISQVNNTAKNGKLMCLYAGRLIGWKGVHLALAAVAEAQTKGIDVTFTVVGGGPLLKKYQEIANTLGLRDKVTFTGQLNQSELFAKYREHNILLFPSLHDSSGNVVLEAFAQGLPVLCLNLGGPSVLVDETCGRAVEARDAPQKIIISRLADALVELASSPELMKKMREGAHNKALALSWDETVNRVYKHVELTFTKGHKK